MSCDTLTFTGITQAQFSELEQKGADAGVAVSGNSGEASHSGVTIAWNYDPATLTLTLTCTHKPFIVGCEYVNSQLTKLVQSLILAPAAAPSDDIPAAPV